MHGGPTRQAAAELSHGRLAGAGRVQRRRRMKLGLMYEMHIPEPHYPGIEQERYKTEMR